MSVISFSVLNTAIGPGRTCGRYQSSCGDHTLLMITAELIPNIPNELFSR
jgi:hypothetical protein